MTEQSPLKFDLSRRLVVQHANNPAETILACAAMLATYHGSATKMRDLRQQHQFAEVDLKNAIGVIQSTGFNYRKVSCPAERLSDVRVPAIVELEEGHYAVLSEIKGSRSILFDPLSGWIEMPLPELASRILLEITPDVYSKGPIEKKAVGLLALWTKAYGLVPAFAQVAGITALIQILAFIAPLQMQLVIDRAIGESDMDLLLVICLAFGMVAVMQGIVEALRGWTLQVISQSLTFQTMRNLMLHTIRLPISFFSARHTGDVMSRLQSSRQMLDMFAQGVVAATFDGIMAIFLVFILLIYSVQLTAITVITLGLVLIINLAIFPAIRASMTTELSERAMEQTLQIEMIRATTTIKLLGREADRLAIWSERFSSAINASINVQRLMILQGFVRSAIMGIQLVLVTYFGARGVIRGDGLTMGMLVAFMSYQGLFTARAQSLAMQFRQFQFLGLHLERVGELVRETPDQLSTAAIDVQGKIELRNLGFTYHGAQRPALIDIDLTIAAGEFLAVTGPSGGGKTTLMKIILGLYPQSTGDILLDGVALTAGQWRAWREHVGVVTQDDQLLSGTIKENICFFDPEGDMARIREAAKLAAIDMDIMAMPQQYAMLVGDMGSALSAGQRQRVLLARALYRRPKILILDEGTANLDLANERSIGEVIRNLDITRVIVAHRPALIEIADRVVTVSHGRVKIGNFEEDDASNEMVGEGAK